MRRDVTIRGDGREEALLKSLQSNPSLSHESTANLSLYDRSQKVLDAIHEFGKGENRYLMSVGDTKGRKVEEFVKERKPKVSGCVLGLNWDYFFRILWNMRYTL